MQSCSSLNFHLTTIDLKHLLLRVDFCATKKLVQRQLSARSLVRKNILNIFHLNKHNSMLLLKASTLYLKLIECSTKQRNLISMLIL